MVKGLCIFLAILTLLMVFPTTALAQPMISGFQGVVLAGGAKLPDGSTVSGWIDGVKVVEGPTTGSAYSLFIGGNYAGKTVTFKVGKYEAEQTGTWEKGKNFTLNLTINSWPYQCEFYGAVTSDGNKVPDGTMISAWVDSARVQTTTTTDSLYRLIVPGNYTDKSISFMVGDDAATQIVAWERGGEIETSLTVSLGPSVCGFYGTVKLDKQDALDGIEVSAWIDGTKVQTTNVAKFKYALNIPGAYSGKTVTFQVNGQRAMESTVWVRGGNKQVALTAITKGTPVVTLDLSSPQIRPGTEFTLTVNVDPKGNGISGGEIDLLSIDTSVMEIVLDKVTAGKLLGPDVIEGLKDRTAWVGGESLKYALARKGLTPIPTDTNAMAVITLRLKGGARPGKYAIPNTVSLTDEGFNSLSFTPPTVSVTVVSNIPGDMDGDNIVGLKDLVIMASAYTKAEGDTGYRYEADLNGDKKIGLADLAILAGNWGQRN